MRILSDTVTLASSRMGTISRIGSLIFSPSASMPIARSLVGGRKKQKQGDHELNRQAFNRNLLPSIQPQTPRSIFQRQWFVPAQHDRVYPRCLGSDSYSPQPGGDGLNTVREMGHTLVSCNNVRQDDDSFERFHTAIVRTVRSIACGLWCRPNKNKNPVTDLVHVVLCPLARERWCGSSQSPKVGNKPKE